MVQRVTILDDSVQSCYVMGLAKNADGPTTYTRTIATQNDNFGSDRCSN